MTTKDIWRGYLEPGFSWIFIPYNNDSNIVHFGWLTIKVYVLYIFQRWGRNEVYISTSFGTCDSWTKNRIVYNYTFGTSPCGRGTLVFSSPLSVSWIHKTERIYTPQPFLSLTTCVCRRCLTCRELVLPYVAVVPTDVVWITIPTIHSMCIYAIS